MMENAEQESASEGNSRGKGGSPRGRRALQRASRMAGASAALAKGGRKYREQQRQLQEEAAKEDSNSVEESGGKGKAKYRKALRKAQIASSASAAFARGRKDTQAEPERSLDDTRGNAAESSPAVNDEVRDAVWFACSFALILCAVQSPPLASQPRVRFADIASKQLLELNQQRAADRKARDDALSKREQEYETYHNEQEAALERQHQQLNQEQDNLARHEHDLEMQEEDLRQQRAKFEEEMQQQHEQFEAEMRQQHESFEKEIEEQRARLQTERSESAQPKPSAVAFVGGQGAANEELPTSSLSPIQAQQTPLAQVVRTSCQCC